MLKPARRLAWRNPIFVTLFFMKDKTILCFEKYSDDNFLFWLCNKGNVGKLFLWCVSYLNAIVFESFWQIK